MHPKQPKLDYDSMVEALETFQLQPELCRRYRSLQRRQKMLRQAWKEATVAFGSMTPRVLKIPRLLERLDEQRQSLEQAIATAILALDGRELIIRFEVFLSRQSVIEALARDPARRLVIGVIGSRAAMNKTPLRVVAAEGGGLAVIRRKDLLDLLQAPGQIIGIRASNGSWVGMVTDPGAEMRIMGTYDFPMKG